MPKRWMLMALVVAVAGCERVTVPEARRAAVAPGIEIQGRRFDTLEWPLTQRRIQLPGEGVLERVARLLRFPKESTQRITGLEIRDTTAWRAVWSNVAAGDSLRAPLPFVDFSRDMVYVVVAEQSADGFLLERIAIERVYRIETRYSVYTTTRHTVEPSRVGAQMVDAIVIPTVDLGVTLFVSGDASAHRVPAR